MSNVIKRILSGTVYVLVTTGAIMFGGNEVAMLYFFALSILTYREFLKIANSDLQFRHFLPGLIVAPAVFALVYFNQNSLVNTGLFTGLLLALLLVPMAQQLLVKFKDPLRFLGSVYFGYILVVIPFALLSRIGNLPYPGSDHEILLFPYTPVMVMVVFIFIWVSDTFAFVGGKLAGKTKLAPGISPGKTIEGFISGLIMANFSALIIYPLCADYLSLPALVILANICVVSGVAGDLLISRFKRSLNIKDSGNVIPGHGGFLDRFDSLLIGGSAAYIYLDFVLKLG